MPRKKINDDDRIVGNETIDSTMNRVDRMIKLEESEPDIDLSDFNEKKNYDTENKNNLTFIGHLEKYKKLIPAMNKAVELDDIKKIEEEQNLHFANMCRQVRLYLCPEYLSKDIKTDDIDIEYARISRVQKKFCNMDYLKNQCAEYTKKRIKQ